MISTKGRYALRIMIDLAEHRNGGFIPMKEVAARQEISLKYIERIMPVLTKNNLVKGLHGKGGGYQLTRDPFESIGEGATVTQPRHLKLHRHKIGMDIVEGTQVQRHRAQHRQLEGYGDGSGKVGEIVTEMRQIPK